MLAEDRRLLGQRKRTFLLMAGSINPGTADILIAQTLVCKEEVQEKSITHSNLGQ